MLVQNKRAVSNGPKIHSLMVSVEPIHPSDKLHELKLNLRTPIHMNDDRRETLSKISGLKIEKNGLNTTKYSSSFA